MNASDYRARAREALTNNWMNALLVTLLASILGGCVTINEGTAYGTTFKLGGDSEKISDTISNYDNIQFIKVLLPIALGVISVIGIIAIIQFIIGGFISLGLIRFNMNLIDGKDAKVNDLFFHSAILAKAFWLKVRMAIFTFLWTLLFIIPGIIKSFSYSMSGFIMAENPEMSAKEAMETSMAMMNGNKWRLFCLYVSFIGWILLCVLTFGIGSLWLNPYMNASVASFYDDISRKSF